MSSLKKTQGDPQNNVRSCREASKRSKFPYSPGSRHATMTCHAMMACHAMMTCHAMMRCHAMMTYHIMP